MRNTRTGFGWQLVAFCIIIVIIVAALAAGIATLANLL